MGEITFSRSRLAPFIHQREDATVLVNQPFLFITSQMRTGKTKIVIDAAQILFELNQIDRVVVIAPAPVRDVWYDKDLGELQKHLWLDFPATVIEFHSRTRTWDWGDKTAPRRLQWIITNYEFLRQDRRLDQLIPYCTPRTLLVCDESSAVKNHDAQQTKAVVKLRWKCGRVVLLNGTPISHNPLDLFSQGNLLHPKILDCRYITHFKARYAKLQNVTSKRDGKPLLTPRGSHIQQIVGWVNLDDIQRRFAPYVIRRLQKDCLDLPPKLDPVTMTAELTPKTWSVYKQMRDELVVWLSDNSVATAPQAVIKTLRLAQITSGFIGGVEDANVDEVLPGLLESIDWGEALPSANDTPWVHEPSAEEKQATAELASTLGIREIGREKLDVLLWFLKERFAEDPFYHCVVWCRFRAELFRILREVGQHFPQVLLGSLHGQQKKAQRQAAMQLLHPDTSPKDRPVFVGSIYGTGSYGLNFTAASTSINCSFDFSLGKFLQASDRVYGPGQVKPVAYFDIVAQGPRGQKTIDHHIVQARRNNEDIASWTTDAWVKALTTE